MAGDIGIRERAVILPQARGMAAAEAVPTTPRSRVVHMYGSRVIVAEASEDDPRFAADAVDSSRSVLASLSPTERLGWDAYNLRESDAYQSVKASRPRDGESWDTSPETTSGCMPPEDAALARAMAEAGAPTSQRLTGSVAVGVIIVNGPTAALTFTAAEQTKVIAEVQNGLGWLATQSPLGVVFKYDIRPVTINVPAGPGTGGHEAQEAPWRNAAMQALGFGANMAGVTAYVESIRSSLSTTWTYCVFFTKYPVAHFAYASIGGPRIVMQYANDGWGPDNIDRVFAHETGHIFGAPDEYAASGCDCGGSWGFYGRPNTNCANCAPNGGVDCLMKGNTWRMCVHTPYHLGFPLVQQTYTGVWRQGNDAHYLWVNASWNAFQAKWQQLAGQNLRLIDLKITREDGVERFHGVWRHGTGGYYLWVKADQNSFIAKWQELSGQGLRLVDLEVQNVNGALLYSGVWLPGNDAHYLWVNADWASFHAKWQQLASQNLRLIDLRIVNVGGQPRYFGVWRHGTGGHYLWVNADWNNFTAKWQELAGQGLRLVDIEITQTPQGQRLSGCWLPGNDSFYLWSGADWQHFREKWQEVSASGMRLIDLDVVPGSGAQSPTPDGASEAYGGLAPSASGDDAPGDGGGGEAGSDGVVGFGAGSINQRVPVASGGLPGQGGGSLGDESIGPVVVGVGGGTADSAEGVAEPEPALVLAGVGGGSVS